jgi:Mrp family chromosome partitioning ATPase
MYEIIQKTENKNLDIITLGKTPFNASKLIFSDRFPILLDELKKEYSNIIIDTASIEISYETLHLMRYADINLLIFRMGLSKKESLKDLNSLIEEHNIKNARIVLNQF